MPGSSEVELVERLTDLLLRWSYEGTSGAERIVTAVADHYGVPAQVAFLSDAAILTVGGSTVARPGVPTVPPLHQVSALKQLLGAIDAGQLDAPEALHRLDGLERRPPLYGKALRILGLILFSVGFGISVQATGQEVAASAVLGLCVGLLVVGTDGRPRFALVLPFVASVVVGVLTLIAFRHGWIDGGPIQLMVPALFYFIPGDALGAAMLELADGRITAGSARLLASLAALLMLGFGALVAVHLVNEDESVLFDVTVPGNLGPLAVWGGWVLFALGVMFTFSMAAADFPWALGLVLGTAGVAALAAKAFDDPIATFVAAVAMTVTALLLGRRKNTPPPYVLYLGAFYVLTPGSHGLRGIESWIGHHPVQGVTSLAVMVGLLTALSLGMLLGAVLTRRPLSAGT